jgi:hypothetical protein
VSPIHDTTTPEGTDPLVVLEHLARWLAHATAHVALGGLLGLLAAHAMRRRHLHWSWAAGAVPPLLLAPGAVAGPAATAVLAALLAAVRGRRWHHEDLRAGADLAEVAVRRTTPLDALGAIARTGCTWLRACWPVWRTYTRPLGGGLGGRLLGGCLLGVRVLGVRLLDRRLPGGRRLRELGLLGGRLLGRLFGRRPEGVDELRVGAAARGRPVSIELGGVGGLAGGGTHTLVAGATGSGKTVTLTWIVTQAVARGMAAVVVDPKGDRWARERLRRAATAADRRFLVWTPEGPAVYNPYGHGGATEIADKALAGERFTEPHYLRQAQRYLGHAVRALRAAGAPVSLATLVRALDPEELEVLARELAPERAAAVHAYLDSLTPRQRADLTGVRDRLAIVAESDVGCWLDPAAGRGAEPLDLLAAVRAGAVVYFDLRADSRPLLARMVAGAVVGDLQTVVSALQEHPARCVVAIDEFSAVAVEHVAGLFGRARSAGVSLVLGTQELADLRVPGHEHLREQVLGNLTTLVAHRQVVPESAELVARLSGTAGAWRTTVASDGRSTRTRVAVPAIDAEEAMSLPRGCAAVLRLAGPRHAAVARMCSPDRV